MPETSVRSPTGEIVKVMHPEGASDDEILNYAKQNSTSAPVGPDVVSSVAAAPRKVFEGLAGLPGTARELVTAGMDYVTGRPLADIYAGKKIPGGQLLPTPQDIQARTSKYIGPSYQPKTTAGKYAGSAAEGITGAMLGPGSLMSKLLIGGASGLGAEGGREYSPDHPIIGGLVGGGGAGMLAMGAGRGLEAARNYHAAKSTGVSIGDILGTPSVPAGAVRRVGASAEQDALTLPTAKATQASLGHDETMLMDLGRQLQGRAEQMAVQPGQAQNTVLNAVEGRTGNMGSGAATRIGHTLNENLGPSQDVVQLIDRVDKLVQQQAAPAYKQVMEKYPQIVVPPEITSRPAVANAMGNATDIAANYGKTLNPNQPGLEFWDHVKKGMDQRINGMMRSGMDDLSSAQKADLGGLINAKQSLVSHLDQVTGGEYAHARQIASTKPELHDALDFGRSIFNSKLLPEEVSAHIGDLSLPAQTMAQVGARRELERVLSNTRNEGAKARAFLDTNNNMQKISSLFGHDAAKAIENRVAAENVFQNATDTIARNSRTALRQELAKDTATPNAGDYHTTLTGLVTAPVKSGIGYALEHGMSNTRSGIGDILTAKGEQLPAVVEQLLKYNTKRTANQMAPISQQAQAMARALLSMQAGRQ